MAEHLTRTTSITIESARHVEWMSVKSLVIFVREMAISLQHNPNIYSNCCAPPYFGDAFLTTFTLPTFLYINAVFNDVGNVQVPMSHYVTPLFSITQKKH